MKLLYDVVTFKIVSIDLRGLGTDLAKPGTFKLIPAQSIPATTRKIMAMQPMFSYSAQTGKSFKQLC